LLELFVNVYLPRVFQWEVARATVGPEFLGGLGMPAKSKAQQMAAGAALAAKRGERKKSELKGASRSMEKSMSEKELHELASTKRKSKPRRKSQDS
jgi:hypothetical protein